MNSCVDCRWHQWFDVTGHGTQPVCSNPEKQEDDPITGRSRLRLCVILNSKGECTDFEAKPPSSLKRFRDRLFGR
jgi:hypothetical protein